MMNIPCLSDPHDPAQGERTDRRAVLHLLGGLGALGVWRSLVPGLMSGAVLSARAATAPTAGGPRLVVVMLRGALDGLAAVPVPGDPNWSNLRPATPDSAPHLPLDGLFALHPALSHLHQWYGQRELLVFHAVASPYRERSHFDAQQMLEAGTDRPFALTTGWLGRALQSRDMAGVALESNLPLGLRGAERATTWAPARQGQDPNDDTQSRLQRLYAGDPALARAWRLATEPSAQADGMGMSGAKAASPAQATPAVRPNPWGQLLQTAGNMLARPDGPRVAWLDTDGWDTHSQQTGRLNRLLPQLDQALGTLKASLGSTWAHTTVLVMTEFGRTAVPNGTGGTDHGTGGVAFLAGGAVAGGRVIADWPGLSSAQLLAGRDLRPTQDIRTLLAAVAQRQSGLSASAIARDVIPGVSPGAAAFWKA